MPVIYEILSIAGWSALVAFLIYWAAVAMYRRRANDRRQPRGFDGIQSPTQHHEKQP